MRAIANKDPRHLTELVATMILGLATIAASWAAFQAAKWTGAQAIAFSDAGAARTKGAQAAARADQQTALEVDLFIAWLQAVASEQSPEDLATHGYTPRVGTLSGFLYRRFPDELATIVKSWLATHPFRDRAAPRSPFAMPAFQQLATARAGNAARMADARAADARRFNLHSDRYMAASVLLSIVLFLAGILPHREGRLARRLLMGLTLGLFLLGVGVLLSLPVLLG